MSYIIKNILKNKLSNSIFLVINFIVLLTIILSTSLIREALQLNNDLSKRSNNGMQIKLNFNKDIKIEDMNLISKNIFSNDLYEVGKIGTRIGEKTAFVVGANNFNPKILKLKSGRYISEEEISNGENKVLIGKFFEEYVFKKGNKELINIFDKEYEVVGSLGSKYGNSYYDEIVYMPITSLPNDIKNVNENNIYLYLNKEHDFVKIQNEEIKNDNNISGFERIDISKSRLYDNIKYYKGIIIKILIMSFCIFVNFYLIMAMIMKNKATEISIKKAVGFTNNKIMADIFYETVIVSSIALIFSLIFYKTYQSNLRNQVGVTVDISPTVVFFVFIILILNSLILSRLQLKNIDKYNITQIIQE